MGTIYHYTSLQGFMGIMNYPDDPSKMKFWMSSSDYLKDLTERVHCVQVLSEFIDKIKTDAEFDCLLAEGIKALARSEQSTIIRYFNQYVLPTKYNLILSFSRERDSLPIWGRYADEGNGIAIGINEEALKNIPDDIVSFDVNYTNGKHMWKCWFDLLEQQMVSWREKIKKNDKEIWENAIPFILNTFCNVFKSPFFEYEQEVRLCAFKDKFANNNVKFRASNGLIIPYQEIALNKSLIEEIIIGPSKDPFYLNKSVVDYCFTIGLKGGSSMIKSSTIPLRR